METRAHHVLIGFFTLALAGGALLFALWINQAGRQQQYHEYRVLFEQSVGGLSTDSQVQYNGIEVGNVTELKLNPDDPRQVLADIRVYQDTPIKVDTRARLALASVAGNMRIQLYGGRPESPLLRREADTHPPLIRADPSPIAALFDEGGEALGNINEILSNVNQLFTDDNAQRAEEIVANVAQITQIIASQQEALDTNMALFGELTREATQTLADISKLSQATTQLLEGEGEQMLQSATYASNNVAQAAQRIEQLVENNAQAIEIGLQGTQDIAPALDQLRETLTNLNRLTRRLNENPTDFLLGRDRVEEFSP